MSFNAEKNILILKTKAYTISFALLDPDDISVPKPIDVELPVVAVLSPDLIKKGLKLSFDIGETAMFSITPEGMEITTESEVDEIKINLGKEMIDSLVCGEGVSSKYNLEHINTIFSQINSEAVSISLDAGMPIQIKSSITGGHGTVTYWLAPKVEDG